MSTIPITELPSSKSTNDDAFKALKNNESCLVWTLNQTQGRGSRGREWLAPENHVLALSLGLNASWAPQPQDLCYPLLAGVLLHDILNPFAEGRFKLKWPNDLLFDGKKVAGILCESRWTGREVLLVVGIGINLKYHRSLDDLPKGYAALSSLEEAPPAQQLVQELAMSFINYVQRFRQAQVLNEAWLSRCAHEIGAQLEVVIDQQHFRGHFVGLSRDGCLQMRDASGQLHSLLQSSDDFRILSQGIT